MQGNGKGKLSGKRSIEKRQGSNRHALLPEEDRPQGMDLLTQDPSILIQELLLDRGHTRPPRYPFFSFLWAFADVITIMFNGWTAH